MLNFLKFIGPGFMVAVGYLDPGNWATDLAAGSQFGYKLLIAILFANVSAILLQSLALKLGIVTNLDLAQACKKHFSFYTNLFLWIICEIAICACDLAEVIGTSIALKMLFNIDIKIGVLITGLDVLLIMFGWGNSNSTKIIFERIIITMVLSISVCFIILVVLSQPYIPDVLIGFLPSSVFIDPKALYFFLT